MFRSRLICLTAFLVVPALCGCPGPEEPSGGNALFPLVGNLAPPPAGSSPLPEDADDLLALLGDCDNDGLADWEEIILGSKICDPSDGPDIDGDGVLNENDPDVDGDGIPNRDDGDVDGDGIPNGFDPDVDGDGVPNDQDVDVDGDFVRNRWDLDIDGDGLLNLFDSDADGSEADPAAEEEDEPEDKPGDAPEEDEDEEDPFEGLLGILDEDPEFFTTDIVQGPFRTERDELDHILADILGVGEGDIEDLRRDLGRPDRDADAGQVEDVLIEQGQRALEGEDPDAIDQDRVFNELQERIDALGDLAPIEPGVELAELSDSTNLLFDVAEEIDEEPGALVKTAVALGDAEVTHDVTEAAEVATDLVDQAHDVGIPAEDVPPAVPAIVRTAQELAGVDAEAEAWAIIAALQDQIRDDAGEFSFETQDVVEVVADAADLIDEPTVDQLSDSVRNILEAVRNQDLDDPQAVLDAIDPADAEDGIDPDEAQAAAEQVDAEQDDGDAP